MKQLTLEQLFAPGSDLQEPAVIYISENQSLQVEQVLRVMPGKRMVVQATVQGKNQLVKIFLKTRNFQQELNHYQQLQKTGVKTPLLLSQQTLDEGGICHYEFIENAHSFAECWRTADEATKTKLLDKLLPLLQGLYDGGLCQTDLHLENFIFSEGLLYALDPAGCETLRDKQMMINNLALLLAQFRLNEWPQVNAAIVAHFVDVEKTALHQQAIVQYKIRTKNFLRKIYRECTYVHAWNIKKSFFQQLAIYCVRERCSHGMQSLLENIDVIPKDAETLKQGNSSIVSSVVVDEKKIVVKNARNKNIIRLLRRCFRRSRASKSWYFSHLLQNAGASVPAPIALIERKLGPLVLESWYVSECIEGDNLLDIWLYQEPSSPELLAIKELFSVMRQLQISHGDMKATNFLVKDDKIFVIDYDGMLEHHSKRRFDLLFQKDKARFFRNWQNRAWLAELSAQII